MKELTLDLVNKLFRYDKETGDLIRKVSVSSRGQAGDIAGAVNSLGYCVTTIEGTKYRNHRVIFLMHNGYLPACLDHIDTNRLNNRIENLRPATTAQNQYNAGIRKDNTSGVKGVTWHVGTGKWQVTVRRGGVKKYFGIYKTISEAEIVAHKAREQLHGEFVNHGVCEEF
mgnify:CR=1 FL=1